MIPWSKGSVPFLSWIHIGAGTAPMTNGFFISSARNHGNDEPCVEHSSHFYSVVVELTSSYRHMKRILWWMISCRTCSTSCLNSLSQIRRMCLVLGVLVQTIASPIRPIWKWFAWTVPFLDIFSTHQVQKLTQIIAVKCTNRWRNDAG